MTGNEWKRALDHHATVEAFRQSLDISAGAAHTMAVAIGRAGFALVSLSAPATTVDETLQAEAEASWFREESP